MRQMRWTGRAALWLCVLALSWHCGTPISAIELPDIEGTEAEKPAVDAPEGETPGTETPGTETPGTETPGTEKPELEAPGTEEPETEEEAPQAASYEVHLEACRIGAEELYSYTTISPAYAGSSSMEGYYPGKLTVSVEGQIVIEAGGELSIGTLSLGGPEESPVLSGTGQIIVKAGGSLRLTDVVFADDVEGPMIVQEPGGSVVLQWTEEADGMVQWSSPLVNNRYDSPDDLWLEAGTVLTSDMLPTTMETDLQYQGTEEWQSVALSWDLSEYNGQTDGTWKISGVFLDESGQTMQSVRPLEMTVHWYIPEALVVTSAVWKGENVPTAQLVVQNLPEFADVWGEVSEDDGETWTIWKDAESFFLVAHEPEGDACIFVLPDETPRLFRIVAEDPIEHTYWRSEAFSLYPEEQEDSGGNRGGSITPVTPSREPTLVLPEIEITPEETPPAPTIEEDTPAAPESSIPTEDKQPVEANKQTEPQPAETETAPLETEEATAPTEEPAGTAETPAQEPNQSEASADPLPVSEPAVASSPDTDPAEPAEVEQPEQPEQPEQHTALPIAAQVLLVAAGAAACAVIALAVAGVGPFRRKK